MKKSTLETLHEQLFTETDGIKFSKLKDKLIKKYGESNREEVLDILTQYVRSGKILHWREFLMSDIAELVKRNEEKYRDFFEWTLNHKKFAYWGVEGLLKTTGKEAYSHMVAVISSGSYAIETRAKAIKEISNFSNQKFDRDLPRDPGYWKLRDLRIEEILEWQRDGYKDGTGYVAPPIHPSLIDPKTDLEKVVAEIDKQLQIERKKNQDLSSPSNWLSVAEESHMSEIKKKWTLPSNYLTFLERYSPIKVSISKKRYFQGLSLYGASDLIKAQAGYSYHATTRKKIKEWPSNLVVIADAGGDPFCIDISQIKNQDAPIFRSEHGMGHWEFVLYAKSFLDFLKNVAKK
jgi:hypothetical protein